MLTFDYEALDDKAKQHDGKLEAETTDEAVAALEARGLRPLSVRELDADGKPVKGGSAWLIIGGAFLIGVVFPLINGRIRTQFIDYGAAAIVGVPLACGTLFALVAAMLTLAERIKDPGKRSLFIAGGIFVIVVLALVTLMVVASALGWD